MSSLTGEDMIDPHEFAKKAFLHTRKEYWGGSWYPYWSLMLVTLLGGFFGLDHIWLRSPQTGILKFIINLLTFTCIYLHLLTCINSLFIGLKLSRLPLQHPNGHPGCSFDPLRRFLQFTTRLRIDARVRSGLAPR